MGTGASILPETAIQDLENSSVFNAQEITKLLKRYSRYDPNIDQGLMLKDMLGIPEISTCPLMPKIVGHFIDRETKKLTYEGFISMLSVLNSRTSLEDKKKFVFRVLDTDGNGSLSYDELFSFYRTILGPAPSDAELLRIVNGGMTWEGAKRDLISYEDFCQLVSDDELKALFTLELQLP